MIERKDQRSLGKLVLGKMALGKMAGWVKCRRVKWHWGNFHVTQRQLVKLQRKVRICFNLRVGGCASLQ